MGFHGTQGTFRFKGATSIPQMQSVWANDAGYTREFIAGEPMTIRFPFGYTGSTSSPQSTMSSFMTTTVAAPFEERFSTYQNKKDFNVHPKGLTSFPKEFKNRFANDPLINTEASFPYYIRPQGEGHFKFVNEEDEYIYFASKFPFPGFQYTYANGAIPIPHIVDQPTTYIPFVWGSIIEGMQSGAKRFLVGPKQQFASKAFYNEDYGATSNVNPFYPNFIETLRSGTGSFSAGDFLFIAPEHGTTSEYNHERHSLFSYVGSTKVSGRNLSFLPKSPFSHENLNYSGFRLRNRKPYPVPYLMMDDEQMNALKNGTTVEPDKSVLSTFGESSIISTTNPTRRHAFAITKRHVLGLGTPFHFYPYNEDKPFQTNFGFGKSVSGQNLPAFTDYKIGDKIYFQTTSGSVIERTVVATLPFDILSVHNTFNKLLSGVFQKLDSKYFPPVIGYDDDGLTTYTYYPEKFGEDSLITVKDNSPRFARVNASLYITYGQITGDVTSPGTYFFVSDNHPWGGSQEEPGATDGLWYDCFNPVGGTSNVLELVGTPNISGDDLLFLNGNGYRNMPGDSTSGYFKKTFLGVNDIGLGETQSPIFPDITVPNIFRGSSGQTFGTKIYKFGVANSVETFDVSPSGFSGVGVFPSSSFQYSPEKMGKFEQYIYASGGLFARGDSLTEFSPTKQNLINANISSDIGVVGFAAAENLSDLPPVVKPSTLDPSIAIPPKEIDSSLPESDIDEQLYYLPTAARNAVRELFPYGLNNLLYIDSVSKLYSKSILWHYLVSHIGELVDTKCSIHLLDADLPDSVKPIAFLDRRRSELHKHQIFFDDQMRGFITKNCPIQAQFSPISYLGYPHHPTLCNTQYAIGSNILTYDNPYGESTLAISAYRVGKCGQSNINLFDDCGEEPGSRIGENCRWRVNYIGKTPYGVLPESDLPSLVKGNFGIDFSVQTNCYDCWHDSRHELPINTFNEDRLNDVTTNTEYFQSEFRLYSGGADTPGPIFTYGSKGVPVLTQIVKERVSGNQDFSLVTGQPYGYLTLFQYSVTGHYGPDIMAFDGGNNSNLYTLYQNITGGTNAEDGKKQNIFMQSERSVGTVIAYDKDVGHLILGVNPWNERGMGDPLQPGRPILSNDVLRTGDPANCEIFTGTGPSGYITWNTGYYPDKCETPPDYRPYGMPYTFGHALGKTGYAYTLDENGNAKSWITLLKGGPYEIDPIYYANPFRQGMFTHLMYPFSSAVKKDDCSFVLDNEYKTANRTLLYLSKRDMGHFLSDQPIYFKSSNTNDPNPYYYFGKISDVFYRMLDDFNKDNGVTAQYRCEKEIIKFDSESDVNNYPNYLEPPQRIRTPMPSLTRIYSGVNIRESEFLK